MRNKLAVLIAFLAIGVCVPNIALAQSSAANEVKQFEKALTIPLGVTTATATINFNGVIRGVSCYVATLDAADTATLTLRLKDKAGNLWTPNGWVDTVVGATADGAVVVASPAAGSSSVTNGTTVSVSIVTNATSYPNFDIYAGGPVVLGITASTTQTAARACRFAIVGNRMIK